MPCFFLPPLSDSQEDTEAPHHWAFWLLLLFAKIAKARLVSCHKNIESKTHKMLVPKKYRFIHLVITVCSHAMQPLTTIPLWPPPSFSFLRPKSTPTCITASPTLVPLKPLFSTVSLLRSLWFQMNWPSQKERKRRKRKKKKNDRFG